MGFKNFYYDDVIGMQDISYVIYSTGIKRITELGINLHRQQRLLILKWITQCPNFDLEILLPRIYIVHVAALYY